MKTTIPSLGVLLPLVTVLCGCGQSKPESTPAEQKTSSPAASSPAAATPAPATPVAQPAPAAQPAAQTASAAQTAPADQTPPTAQSAAAAQTPPTAQAPPTAQTPPAAPTAPAPVATSDSSTATDAASQLVSAAKTQGDTVLSSVGGDLKAKVGTLVQSAAGNDTLKSQVTSSLKSLAGGNEATGLTTIYQTAQLPGLTPSQIGLAKEVGNLASAYVVQRNFASLDGAQGDVASIVNSLRQGQFTPAIPAIQRVSQNANLTPTQKQLVASIADRYAPGVSKAAGALSGELQKIPGLGK